jgi:hypothetical protein
MNQIMVKTNENTPRGNNWNENIEKAHNEGKLTDCASILEQIAIFPSLIEHYDLQNKQIPNKYLNQPRFQILLNDFYSTNETTNETRLESRRKNVDQMELQRDAQFQQYWNTKYVKNGRIRRGTSWETLKFFQDVTIQHTELNKESIDIKAIDEDGNITKT